MSTIILNGHIEATADVMGGKPRITGRRITVEDVVVWHERLGKNVDEIATEYKLALADVYAALTYYYDNQQEIDQNIREKGSWLGQLKRENPTKLK